MSGDYYRPQPIDFIILELLPEVGMIGGIHWKGRQARDVRNEILERNGTDPELIPANLVISRIRSMSYEGLVRNFSGATKAAAIWARTPKGTEFLGRRDEVLSEVQT